MNLELLGADSSVYGAFEMHAANGLTLGRVSTVHRGRYHLYTDAGEAEAEASGALWYRSPDPCGMPVTGDWVAARSVGDGQAIVEAVLPRRSLFARRAAGRREEVQPIAANIDTVFVVCGLDGDFNLRRVERYLALAAESGADPVIVLNKADVCEHLAERLEQTAAVAGSAAVVVCSALDPGGVPELGAYLGHGRTVALLGSSGVGKSTIANCLIGEERLRTQEVRLSDSRGRHTTTHRELIPLPGGGALIDTPGMRELQLWAGQESVDVAFDEIAAAARLCRYRDCGHQGEPGCAVQAALAEGRISAERWESYRKLGREVRRHELLSNEQAAQEEKRKLKRMHRAINRYYRERR